MPQWIFLWIWLFLLSTSSRDIFVHELNINFTVRLKSLYLFWTYQHSYKLWKGKHKVAFVLWKKQNPQKRLITKSIEINPYQICNFEKALGRARGVGLEWVWKNKLKLGTNFKVSKKFGKCFLNIGRVFFKILSIFKSLEKAMRSVGSVIFKKHFEDISEIWNQLQCIQNLRKHPLNTERVFFLTFW